MRAIRWSDNDHYFGPFTYARDGRGYRPFALLLGSGDGDDYPHCRFRMSAFGHTLIIAMPAVIKPWRKWVDTSRYEWSKSPNGGYWDTGEREYGFTASGGHVSVALGRVTNDSSTEQRWGFFLPWRQSRHIRHSLFDLEGEHFADLPEWGFRYKNGWAVKNAIEDACPAAHFVFKDFDGEELTARTRIEEREWRKGTGWFRWLAWFVPNRISRSLDIWFSGETGRRKGSWKGGTLGHSISMLPGELHEAAFRRYCGEHGMQFVGLAQVGTHPKGADAKQAAGDSLSNAVRDSECAQTPAQELP